MSFLSSGTGPEGLRLRPAPARGRSVGGSLPLGVSRAPDVPLPSPRRPHAVVSSLPQDYYSAGYYPAQDPALAPPPEIGPDASFMDDEAVSSRHARGRLTCGQTQSGRFSFLSTCPVGVARDRESPGGGGVCERGVRVPSGRRRGVDRPGSRRGGTTPLSGVRSPSGHHFAIPRS